MDGERINSTIFIKSMGQLFCRCQFVGSRVKKTLRIMSSHKRSRVFMNVLFFLVRNLQLYELNNWEENLSHVAIALPVSFNSLHTLQFFPYFRVSVTNGSRILVRVWAPCWFNWRRFMNEFPTPSWNSPPWKIYELFIRQPLALTLRYGNGFNFF